MFAEYLCNRNPQIKTKNIKHYGSILAVVNHRNWLDDSPPLSGFAIKKKLGSFGVVAFFERAFKVNLRLHFFCD